eukprot:8757839-Lingulodinium_polyedra.AAC.1
MHQCCRCLGVSELAKFPFETGPALSHRAMLRSQATLTPGGQGGSGVTLCTGSWQVLATCEISSVNSAPVPGGLG